MIDFDTKYRPGLVWSTNSDAHPKTLPGRMLLRELISGPPQATQSHSVASLERLGIIGLYLPPDAPVVAGNAKGFFLQ